VREVQLLLANDKMLWSQVKSQIVYRLDTLKRMDEIGDFADELQLIAVGLGREEETRKQDDQDIIDVLNDVCYKMSMKFQN